MTAESKVAQVNRLLGVNLWDAPSFRADVRIDFHEDGSIYGATLLNPAAVRPTGQEGTVVDEPSVRWCGRDDAHPAHERRNLFGGKDYCTGMSGAAAARGRPPMSADTVTEKVADRIARARGYVQGACVDEHYRDAWEALSVLSNPEVLAGMAEVLRKHSESKGDQGFLPSCRCGWVGSSRMAWVADLARHQAIALAEWLRGQG